MNRRQFISTSVLVSAATATGAAQDASAKPGAAVEAPAEKKKFSAMRTIALEEHYVSPAFMAGLGKAMEASRDPYVIKTLGVMKEVGPGRAALMDAAGIDMQFLSHAPGLEQLVGDEQIAMVRDTNDFLRDCVAKMPQRFGGFASLPTATPSQGVKELERMIGAGFKGAVINGHSRGRYLDDKFFWPILEAAQHLDVPVYLHPTPPPQAVIDAYYSGFAEETVDLFSTAGWGWHVETGVHVVRMCLGGVFDQFPRLKIIVGHMGELLPFMLPRMDHNMNQRLTKLKNPLSFYLRQNLYYTPAGFNFVQNFYDLMTQVGVDDRIMFSCDCPFGSMLEARQFLDNLPISPADREKIAHENAERLLRI